MELQLGDCGAGSALPTSTSPEPAVKTTIDTTRSTTGTDVTTHALTVRTDVTTQAPSAAGATTPDASSVGAKHEGLDGSALAGIAVGAVVALLLLCACVGVAWRTHKNTQDILAARPMRPQSSNFTANPGFALDAVGANNGRAAAEAAAAASAYAEIDEDQAGGKNQPSNAVYLEPTVTQQNRTADHTGAQPYVVVPEGDQGLYAGAAAMLEQHNYGYEMPDAPVTAATNTNYAMASTDTPNSTDDDDASEYHDVLQRPANEPGYGKAATTSDPAADTGEFESEI